MANGNTEIVPRTAEQQAAIDMQNAIDEGMMPFTLDNGAALLDERDLYEANGACLPALWAPDKDKFKNWRAAGFLFKFEFAAGAGPGGTNTLTLAKGTKLSVGKKGQNESAVESGWAPAEPGGSLTPDVTDLNSEGSFSFGNGVVFGIRGFCAYPEHPFCVDQNQNNRYPRWLKPWTKELMDAVWGHVALRMRQENGGCLNDVDKLALWNAMGGLTFSDTPSNSNGIANNYMRFTTVNRSGARGDADKVIIEAETYRQAVLEDSAEQPAVETCYVPVHMIFIGRACCRLRNAAGCATPELRELRKVKAEFEAFKAEMRAIAKS